MRKVFPANEKLVHQTDAKLVVIMQHIKSLLANMTQGIDYIEDLLYVMSPAACCIVVSCRVVWMCVCDVVCVCVCVCVCMVDH